jgi:hypothetical protein
MSSVVCSVFGDTRYRLFVACVWTVGCVAWLSFRFTFVWVLYRTSGRYRTHTVGCGRTELKATHGLSESRSRL